MAARRPAAYGQRVTRLFPDFRRVERAYYEKTGIFPIMHTLVMREELARQHPWLPRSLYDAFVEAKRLAYERLNFTAALPVSLPWLVAEAEETRALMGTIRSRTGSPGTGRRSRPRRATPSSRGSRRADCRSQTCSANRR